MDSVSYQREFLVGPTEMTEISVWEGNRLKAIVLTDVEPNAVAGVTHYYDPDWRERSIGLFAMLQTFLLARELGKKWVYLGYYVENSPTMGYKLQFRPCELRGWDGTWERIEK
jgi:arginine-tRNA-protein transferase